MKLFVLPQPCQETNVSSELILVLASLLSYSHCGLDYCILIVSHTTFTRVVWPRQTASVCVEFSSLIHGIDPVAYLPLGQIGYGHSLPKNFFFDIVKKFENLVRAPLV